MKDPTPEEVDNFMRQFTPPLPQAMPEERVKAGRGNHGKFIGDLQNIINSNSMENGSDTPDFLLARYINACLLNWNAIITAREEWHGRKTAPIPKEDWPITPISQSKEEENRRPSICSEHQKYDFTCRICNPSVIVRELEAQLAQKEAEIERLKKDNHDLRVNYVLQNPFSRDPEPAQSATDREEKEAIAITSPWSADKWHAEYEKVVLARNKDFEERKELMSKLLEERKRREELEKKFGFTYCAYCGMSWAVDDKNEDLSNHIKVCEKHPMRDLESKLSSITQENEEHKEQYVKLSWNYNRLLEENQELKLQLGKAVEALKEIYESADNGSEVEKIAKEVLASISAKEEK